MQPRLFFQGAEIAWPEFEQRALRAANGFERLGEGDVVCVMLRNEPAFLEAIFAARLDAGGVRDWLRERIAGYKVPRLIEFRDALPRDDSGKIFKRRLREPYWEKAGRRI